MNGTPNQISKWLEKYHGIRISGETLRRMAKLGVLKSEQRAVTRPQWNMIINGQDVVLLVKEGKLKQTTSYQLVDHRPRGRKKREI